MVLAVIWTRGGTALDVVWAVSWAVIIGGAIHLAVCLPPLWSRWGLIRPRLDLRTDPRFMRVLGEMGKVIIGVMAQVNTLVLRYIASHLQEGAVTWYWNATRLVDFAQGIIAVESALRLPAISAAAAETARSFGQHSRVPPDSLASSQFQRQRSSWPSQSPVWRCSSARCLPGRTSPRRPAHCRCWSPSCWRWPGFRSSRSPFFALERRGVLIGVGGLGVLLTGGLGLWLAPTMGVDGLAPRALSLDLYPAKLAYIVVLRGSVEGTRTRRAFLDVGRMMVATLPAVGLAWIGMTRGEWLARPTLQNGVIFAGSVFVGALVYAACAMHCWA